MEQITIQAQVDQKTEELKQLTEYQRGFIDGAKEAMKQVNIEFTERRKSMENRSPEEQNIIGNTYTSTEIEIEKRVKPLYRIDEKA